MFLNCLFVCFCVKWVLSFMWKRLASIQCITFNRENHDIKSLVPLMPFPYFSIFFLLCSYSNIFPKLSLCDSHIHYAFLILILLQKNYGLPLPDVDIAASPGLEWIISWKDKTKTYYKKYLVLNLTLKNHYWFWSKRALLGVEKMPKPGHLIFYMLKTVGHVNI